MMKDEIEKLKRRVEIMKKKKGKGEWREGKSIEGREEVEAKVRELVRRWREIEEREGRRKM